MSFKSSKASMLPNAVLWALLLLIGTTATTSKTFAAEDSAVIAESNTPPVTNAFLGQLEPLQNARYISTPNNGHEDLIAAFNAAKKSIKIGIFGISDKLIADSLSAATKRGVAVTVICDKYCEASPSRLAITQQLRADGVEFYIASAGFNISHWKMFVIDESMVFVSTMNFITRHQQMRDMGIFLTNPSIVQEILAVFNADIENSKNATALTPMVTQPNLVWSPINSENKLVQLINSAKSSIEIWIENMGDVKLQEALKNAVQRHVKVRILTSVCGMGGPSVTAYANLSALALSGIMIQAVPFPASSAIPYIHAKTINVDHQTVFLGSENFSRNSLLFSRELGLIFNDPLIESQMANLYEADWKQSVLLPAIPPETCTALTPSTVL
ncbi:MAG: phospholipase D-like domain-containing protein [Pseudobdellovibrio sp.]